MELHPKKQLTQNEIADTFVKVLTDTYKLKQLLLSQLPGMTYKSQESRLKMLIISARSSLDIQILRLNLAMRQLNRTCFKEESLTKKGLNIKKYLSQDIDSLSLYNDAELILSQHLYPKSINSLMKLNLGEAIKYEKSLVAIYKSYLIEN
jgi:hypothetical protein